jgi:hypothetical protein
MLNNNKAVKPAKQVNSSDKYINALSRRERKKLEHQKRERFITKED